MKKRNTKKLIATIAHPPVNMKEDSVHLGIPMVILAGKPNKKKKCEDN